MFSIEQLNENEYNLTYTYNLYGGMSIQNKIKVYSKKHIENIVKDNDLSVEFTNFVDTGIMDGDTINSIQESLRTRMCFTIRKIQHTI